MHFEPMQPADYDHIGRYDQDEINGLDDTIIIAMIESAHLTNGMAILDAMGGNGNLSQRIIAYCEARNIRDYHITILDLSNRQLEYARRKIDRAEVTTVCGDIFSELDDPQKSNLAPGSFDVVFIKSGFHEVNKSDQPKLYSAVLKSLSAGGVFVNLGMAFEDSIERDEFASVTRIKDTLAHMNNAMAKRYFPLKTEFHHWLYHAGFSSVATVHTFNYSISIRRAAGVYFQVDPELHERTFLQALSNCATLQGNGRIAIRGGETVMVIPGEITSARKET